MRGRVAEEEEKAFRIDRPSGWPQEDSAAKASYNLESCLTSLQIYRIIRVSSDPQQMKMKMLTGPDIEHCVAYGTVGRFDLK